MIEILSVLALGAAGSAVAAAIIVPIFYVLIKREEARLANRLRARLQGLQVVGKLQGVIIFHDSLVGVPNLGSSTASPRLTFRANTVTRDFFVAPDATEVDNPTAAAVVHRRLEFVVS